MKPINELTIDDIKCAYTDRTVRGAVQLWTLSFAGYDMPDDAKQCKRILNIMKQHAEQVRIGNDGDGYLLDIPEPANNKRVRRYELYVRADATWLPRS